MSKTKYPGVKRLPSGGIEYRGTKFAGLTSPSALIVLGKRAWFLPKRVTRLSSSIMAIALWDITILRRHGKVSNHDTERT